MPLLTNSLLIGVTWLLFVHSGDAKDESNSLKMFLVSPLFATSLN